jgi:hypothetical protein
MAKKLLLTAFIFISVLATANATEVINKEKELTSEVKSDYLLFGQLSNSHTVVIIDIEGKTLAEKKIGKDKKSKKNQKNKFDKLIKKSEFLLETNDKVYFIYL